MVRIISDFLRQFGENKFGEEKSLLAADFERAFKRFFSFKKKLIPQRYGEKTKETSSLKDFKKSFQDYFK